MASSSAVDPHQSPALAAGAEALVGPCGVLIPAYNEEVTLEGVIAAARAAQLGPVLVVDDGSSDATAQVAASSGAHLLRLKENAGKGGAVYRGALALQTDVLLLLDADLIGLTPAHLHALAEPVLSGRADMSRGMFVGGRWATAAAQHLTPQLSGQRAIRRELLLAVPWLEASRYGLEVAITEQAKHQRWRTENVPLTGVSQVMKEEKRGFWRGFRVRLEMYRDVMRAYLRGR